MNVSKARSLLAEAGEEQERTRKHLLVAAALQVVLGDKAIVVGGTAQDFYTGGVYRQTDLDLVGWLTDDEERLLVTELGFTRDEERHLFHAGSNVAVEFPEGSLAGARNRVRRVEVRPGTSVALISVEDLYLDRVRQATMRFPPPPRDVNLRAALAVAVACFEEIDWKYVSQHLRETEQADPPLGTKMRKVHNSVRRRALASV